MGGGAFILLKVGSTGPESTKQVEIRLANLQKILHIARSEALKPSPRPEKERAIVLSVGISAKYG
jgi:hypothetical protein